jgi:AraC-like DNA-binding protein
MGSACISSSSFSTRDFDVWRENIGVVFEVGRTEDASTEFSAKVEAFQLGDMVIADSRLGAQRYVRSSSQLRRDGLDHYLLNLYRTGGGKAQSEQGEFQGEAGQISVLDLSRELISDEPQSDLVALFLPREMLEERLPNLGALHGQAPRGPYAALLADYLDLLGRRLPTLPDGDASALSRATLDILTACIKPSLAHVEAVRPGLELVLRRRARRFIDAHLGSEGLDSDAICNALGVSRRTLYRLFDDEGGVQHYIQARRLDRIRSRLADASETRRISEIAAEFGFLRSDHFARAFRRQFGHSPRDVRAADRQTEAPTPRVPRSLAPDDQAPGFDDWIRALHA